MPASNMRSTDHTLAATPATATILNKEEQPMLVIVDPMSTGATLACAADSRGLPVCCVWSDLCPESLRHFVAEGQTTNFVGVVTHTGDIKSTIAALTKIGKVGEVMPGSEPGVELADELANALGCRGNGTAQSACRRNKFEQSEAIRAKGLSAGAQALVANPEEVEAFLKTHCMPFTKLVVKPVDGAASEGVTICSSAEQVRECVRTLQASTNVFGQSNEGKVLLMEYLGGDEYVVDTVSRDGVHKCVAIWKYMKQPCNGVQNCWFGQRLMAVDDEAHLALFAPYIFGALDAIGIQNGAVHSEVKMDTSTAAGQRRGPTLIECNCRLHGIEGSWCPIVDKCLGYSQVSALLDAYYEPTAFKALPDSPSTMYARGAQVGVRSMVEGTIASVDESRVAQIRAVESYVGENVAWSSLTAGQPIVKTTDVVTLCGQINLVAESKAHLDSDMKQIEGLVNAGIFALEGISRRHLAAAAIALGAVAIVVAARRR